MAHQFTTSYLADALTLFRQQKSMAEKAIAQIDDQRLTEALDPESNSIAILVKHMAGNMRSRWTDFLATDGEKPDRNRDSEFENPSPAREQLLRVWDEGWSRVFAALEPLTEADLKRTVYIRSGPHSVMQAIQRQIAHYALHIGQIILLAKHFQGERWKTPSLPRKK